MEKKMEQALTDAFTRFRLPRYRELPNMGLYLEQTAAYINQCLEPLECIFVTGSMIRNYVKMKMLKNPVRKQYYAEHIARLLAATILKSVISLEHIGLLFERSNRDYDDEVAWNFFCTEIENAINTRFGLQEEVGETGSSRSAEKTILCSAIRSVAQVVYLNSAFRWIEEGNGE